MHLGSILHYLLVAKLCWIKLPHVRGQGRWPRVTGCDGAGAAERSYPTPEFRGGGWEEQPHVQGVVAEWVQEGWEELLHIQGQEGRLWGDTPLQDKEQRLRFAGAAMKRYPTSKIRETQIRWEVLLEGIRSQTHWNHNHRKLVNLITGTTALSNSMKLSHLTHL